MDKIKAKQEILRIKESIASKKIQFKNFNDGRKRDLDLQKKTKQMQKDPHAKKSLHTRIEYLKKEIATAKESQAREIDRLKSDIARIKNSIS